MAYYAFGAWRRAPLVERGADAFSYHRRTAYAAILYTLVFASLVEVAAVHFVLRAIAPRLSLAVLALSVFGAVWLLGFARSVQLRPITVSDDLLRVRNGLRWSLDIPRATIARLDVGRIRTPAKGTAGYLCAGFGQPNVLIELGAPVVARGPYGTTRSVTHLSFVVDDPARFSATFV